MTVEREVSTLARELVSIPSHVDETVAGDAIEAWLRAETDADVERDAAGNVIARRGTGSTSLALVGHHDVVPPADDQLDDESYVVSERDGRLYGRGTADMKGSVAAAMCAFRDAQPTGELIFASFVGEERGGVGARHAIEEGFAPDYAIVGEGSTGYSAPDVTDVVVAHRGRRGSTLVARGSAAHASEPAAGENAIYAAVDAIDELRRIAPPTVDVFGHELTGSLVVTEIEGGSAMNVIPERCTVTVDERTVPGERAPLEQLVERTGIEWIVDGDVPPMRCDDEGFARLALDVAADSQSSEPALVTKPHATDAGWLAAAGTTTLVCGAAEPGEAHTATESVSVPVLDRCYRIYRGVAEQF